MDANSSPTASLFPRLDWTVLLAVLCLICSWFFMNALVTDLGVIQLTFRFYNVLTLMHSPGRIALGTYGGRATFDAWLFGSVCMLAALAALAPVISRRKIAWLGCVAPFALMALCGAVLYHMISHDFITDNGSMGETGSRFIQFANQLANRVGNVVARQIHVGAGGYLSLAASAVLAVKGVRGYQEAA